MLRCDSSNTLLLHDSSFLALLASWRLVSVVNANKITQPREELGDQWSAARASPGCASHYDLGRRLPPCARAFTSLLTHDS